MNDYTPQAGDLIEVTSYATKKRVRAFVHGPHGGRERLRIQYEHGAFDFADDAKDPVLLDRAPEPWPTTPGSTARLTDDDTGVDYWAVLTPIPLGHSCTHWVTEEDGYRTEAEMRADGWVPVHDAGADQ